MSRRAWDGVLRAGTALGLLVIASAQANAGGFAVREQSVYGQGSSFAGVAAGGALSSMFWNPATMTQFQGIVSETDVSGILPYANNTPTAGTACSQRGSLALPTSRMRRSFPQAIRPISLVRTFGSACPSMLRSVFPKISLISGPAAFMRAAISF